MTNTKVEKLIQAAKDRYGADSYLGKHEWCPKCKKLVYHIRGPVPKCSQCGADTDAVT